MAMKHLIGLFCGLAIGISLSIAAENRYYGVKLGPLSEFHHGVSGEVYAVDSKTLFLKNFNYDGEGPAAYFYVGSSRRPTNEGALRLRDERGRTGVLRRYRNKDITLTLPEGKSLNDIKWFSVWCDEFSVNFGDVTIPKNLNFPRPQKISALRGVHRVSSDNIVIVDAQTLLIPNFSYDGEAPDAKFWVGQGEKPTPQGLRIPDENGRMIKLSAYNEKTIVLTLPNDLTIYDIDYFGVWCEAFTVDFGHIRIPHDINVPPSLRMLGISPQSKLNCEVLYEKLAFEVRWAIAGESVVIQLVAKLENNEYMSFGISSDKSKSVMIGSDVVVAWVDKDGKGYAVDYFLDDKSQCSGSRGSCPDTRIADDSSSIRLLNAATVNGYSIVTYQRPLKAHDPLDLDIPINGSQAIVWAVGPLNQRQEVSFHSSFNRDDRLVDFGRQPIWNCPVQDVEMSMPGSDEPEYSVKPLPVRNSPLASRNPSQSQQQQPLAPPPPPPQQQQQQSAVPSRGNHRHEVIGDGDDDEVEDDIPTIVTNNRNRDNEQRRRPQSNRRKDENRRRITAEQQQSRPVPTPKPVSSRDAWEIPAIECDEPEDGVFYAQMGPTGGKRGYPAITGHVGWGISWYINGLLIPEINVVRGKTYTFVTEGGYDSNIPAKYHPFYITDDPVGGYEYQTDAERSKVQIFAGVTRSKTGEPVPIGTGRHCNWVPDIDGPPADDYPTFGAYQRTLKLKCEDGTPGLITFQPDENTPDTVYYQCYTHRYLGWKINVLDSCDRRRDAYHQQSGGDGEASEIDEVFSEPDQQQQEDDFISEASIRHETKVRPNELFLLQHEKNLIKNHNMNEIPPTIQLDLNNKNSDISKIIADGIRAAEALEESIAHPKRNKTRGGNGNGNGSGSGGNGGDDDDDEQIEFKIIKSKPKLKPQEPLLQVPSYNGDASLISEYLRPPMFQSGPMFRPVKVAQRRPNPQISMETRKPLNNKHNNNNQYRVMLPQPSIIVNHYKKPMSPLMRPFVKQQKPIKSIASFLLLGQPTELGGGGGGGGGIGKGPVRKTFEPQYQESLLLNKGNNGKQHPPQIPQQNNKPYNPTGKYPIAHQTPSSQQLKRKQPEISHPHNLPPQSQNNGLRKKPPVREPYLPLKGEKGSFKLPYEITSFRNKTFSPIRNTGFQPDSVIVESGFKPIVRRHSTDNDDEEELDDVNEESRDNSHRRSDDNLSNIEELLSEGDAALFVNQDIPTKSFEPMFIPSPPDSISSDVRQKHHSGKNEKLSGDLIDMEIEDGDDKLAMAGERIDAYYLPPDTLKTPPHQNVFPERTIVTYDGKAVLDTSLVNSLPQLPPSLPLRPGNINPAFEHLSKTEQLIRSTPQFGPFKGEIPPIGQEFTPPDIAPELLLLNKPNQTKTTNGKKQQYTRPNNVKSQQQQQQQSKQTSPVTEYTNPLTNNTNPISTKLTLLTPINNDRRNKRHRVTAETAAAAVATVVDDDEDKTIEVRKILTQE